MKQNKTLTENENVAINPSYDKSLSPEKRLWDYLGKLHLVLNGVVPHEPFDLRYEGRPNEMCDTQDKKELVEFVKLLIESTISQTKQELIEEIYTSGIIADGMYDPRRVVAYVDKLHREVLKTI